MRYTVTYTPASDRILPAPHHLYLKIKNSSLLALRAAFIHGPYTLYVSSSPATFRTDQKLENPRSDGVPEFEPNLKAGGSWTSKLSVPEDVRSTAGTARSHDDGLQKSVSWIIEVASQVIFSTSASVHYEILLGRDENSLSMGFMGSTAGAGLPGQVSDHQESAGAKDGSHSAQPKGVFSRAIKLKVEDTASLWNSPQLPGGEDEGKSSSKGKENHTEEEKKMEKGPAAPIDSALEGVDDDDEHKDKKRKKVHLVLLTHGLHSNLGADMLFMKESIDEGVRQARIDAKKRRSKRESSGNRDENALPGEHHEDNTDVDDDDEEVIVRGFSGNAVRTEKGIKYLGKRLAKYVLTMTYPDQPYRPITRTTTESFAAAISHDKDEVDEHGLPTNIRSSIRRQPKKQRKPAYTITSISFIAHSLGGLIQTYAVAYIQKHSPQFFELIKPINFVAMATPFLGLSNENPLYVKFALDFGLVGRTGQDLGLTWRPPNLAKTGWGAIVNGIGENAHKNTDPDPGAKPLLRILPTGPAHIALRKFRNRTVYSNVVNDGIVPLRTSCLLFLDWRGLGRVEKARRENGLVGTVAGWGWAELTGANSSSQRRPWMEDLDNSEDNINTPTREGYGEQVPQPSANAAADDDTQSLKSVESPTRATPLAKQNADPVDPVLPTASTMNNAGALDSILGLFRSSTTPKSHNHVPKHIKIYKRSQTIKFDDDHEATAQSSKATSGEGQDDPGALSAPPKTTFFESAGDVLNPPLPPVEFLIDPTQRPRTIFHDRVYHPDDIPPPPVKRKPTRRHSGLDAGSNDSPNSPTENTVEVVDASAMKVEEKIARAYHKDLSWRKVLVRLEPDAHNNMIVRRKFANAYGWPVVKHLVDTHFSDDAVARMRDEDEGGQERAKASNETPDSDGDEIKKSEKNCHRKNDSIGSINHKDRTDSELQESNDHVPPLNSMQPGNLARVLNSVKPSSSPSRPRFIDRQDSAQWSELDFLDSDEDSDTNMPRQEKRSSGGGSGWNWTEAIAGKAAATTSPKVTKKQDIDEFLGLGRSGSDGKVRSGEVDFIVGLDHGAGGSSRPRPDGHAGPGDDTGDNVSKQVAKMSLGGRES